MFLEIRMNIKKYTKFRENSNFQCKPLNIKEDGSIYFENILIEDINKNKTAEGDNFIDISYTSKNSISRVLSNLYPITFTFRHKKVASIEGVLQGIKYKDKKMQNLVLKYFGVDAYHTRACNPNNFWESNGLLYWQGKSIARNSIQYQKFLDELYLSACKNLIYKTALLSTGKKYLLHHIGEIDSSKTILTRFEYEQRLNTLREYLRQTTKKT
jgi:hypothetical protein